MRRAEHFTHVVIVGGALVVVPDHKANGAACRLSVHHSAEQFHFVVFFAVGGNSALSGFPAVQLMLDEIHVDIHAGRHAVNDTTYGFAVAFAKGGQGEYFSKCVAHLLVFISGNVRIRSRHHIRSRRRIRSRRHGHVRIRSNILRRSGG